MCGKEVNAGFGRLGGGGRRVRFSRTKTNCLPFILLSISNLQQERTPACWVGKKSGENGMADRQHIKQGDSTDVTIRGKRKKGVDLLLILFCHLEEKARKHHTFNSIRSDGRFIGTTLHLFRYRNNHFG